MPRIVDQPEYEDLLAVADLSDVVLEMVGRFLTAMYARDEFRAAVFGPGKRLREALRKAGYRAEGELPPGWGTRKKHA